MQEMTSKMRETLEALQKRASAAVQARGRLYADSDKIQDLRVAGGVILAQVQGDDTYRVKIDTKARMRSCSCPAHKHYTGPCKHQCAVIYQCLQDEAETCILPASPAQSIAESY
jgi:uncharacterized Zn finger protein